MKHLLILAVIGGLMGAGWLSSSFNYTKGTKALEEGKPEIAVGFLEKAVEEDPSLARNHNNLAAAYFALDRIAEGWPHVRISVRMEPGNDRYVAHFHAYMKKLIEQGLVKNGRTEAEIQEYLGIPDGTGETGDCKYWQYGPMALCFKAGAVAGFLPTTRRRK
jgi:hypothetical protein